MPKSSVRIGRRAKMACTFCRRRKMKCGGESPKCKNCETYNAECIFEENIKRPRPSNSRIFELEEEKRQLLDNIAELEKELESQTKLAEKVSQDKQQITPTVAVKNTSHSRHHKKAATSTVISTERVSRIFTSANGQPSFYGPTSTLFEDAAGDFGPTPNKSQRDPKIPAEWVEKGLMAEAAHQRQLEAINYSAGKLDFDGVDPDLGMHLLTLHWNRQHHSFFITYRPAFMRDMACNGPYFSKLLLNAIYFASSKFCSRLEVRTDPNNVRTAGLVYRKRVKELLADALDRSEITTIQALLLMATSLFALGDEKSAAWLYAGWAFRSIIDLGMHVDAPILPNLQKLSDEDLEIRRRVFWGAFVVDKIQSLYQGRPVSLQEDEVRVPIRFLDSYEELEYWAPSAPLRTNTHPGSASYSVSTFKELCKLAIIMNRILDELYIRKLDISDNDNLEDVLNSLDSDLKEWDNQLPAHLKYVPSSSDKSVPPPHVFSLLAMYNVLLILLHRPFVSDGHLKSNFSTRTANSFVICAAAAKRIVSLIRAYDYYFSTVKAPYLISYSTYVAATILVRLAAQKELGLDAHASLKICMDTFRENQTTNWAVRRMTLVIESLASRMGVNISEPWKKKSKRSSNPEDQNTTNTESIPDSAQQSEKSTPSPGSRSNLSPDYTAYNANDIYNGLDMDLIVQSFVRGQQSNAFVPQADPGSFGPKPGLSGEPEPTSILPTVISSTADGDIETSFIDLLFGFNGSVVDDLAWDIHDRNNQPKNHW